MQRYQSAYFILLICAMAAAIGALLLLGARPAQGAPSTGTLRYVAKGGSDATTCQASGSPCATIQHAVDVSSPDDEIRVATGTYADTHVKPKADVSTTGTVTQVVYITQSLSIRGGFTTTNWTTQNINANPTILDGGNSARVIYVTGNVTPTVEGFQIKHGDAYQQRGVNTFQDYDAGSGIYVITASLTLSASVVSNNNPAHPPYAGGGMYVSNGRATLISDTFQSNVASSLGGGLYAEYAHSNISNSLFLSNSVTLGGNGGGIYGVQSSYDSSISYSSIISNSAALGGGIYLYDDDTLLTANLIMSNTATSQGGGIWLIGAGGYDFLTNNVIADNVNTTNDGGGGAYFESSHLFLTHNTFARNKGGGAGIYISNAGIPSFPSVASMINSIIFSHTVGITLTHASTNTTSIDGVLWFNNGINYGGLGVFTVTHQYTGSPAFATDRYHLTGASAAIDRGVSAGITTDIDGGARPKGAAPDLGADEFPSQSLYLPLILK